MKSLLRRYSIGIFSLWATSIIIPGLVINGGIGTLLVASLVFLLLTLFIKPILKIVFLPINIITLGLSVFIIHALILFLLTYVVPDITITSWLFPGISFGGYSIPGISFGIIPTYIVSATVLSALTEFFIWL